MVHALTEAHRVLRPEGVVVDLRPDRDPGNSRTRRILVVFQWDGRRARVGLMHESAEYCADYLASDRAVARVLQDGPFLLERSEMFWLRTHFRDLAALERYLQMEWTATTLPRQTRQALRRFTRRHPQGWIVAADPFRLNVLRRLGAS